MMRALLICLLAIALPAQGVMAATMAFCGAHQPDHADVSTVVRGADTGLASSADAHEHAAIAAPGEKGSSDKAAMSDMHKCTVCAACCSPMALNDMLPKLPLLEPATTMFIALATAVKPSAVSGPERPPRQVLA